MESSDEKSTRLEPAFLAYILVGLSVLACALGGSTRLWAQAFLAIASGVLFVCFPPRRFQRPLPTLGFVAVFFLSLTAFLPATWFGSQSWRAAISKLGVALPATLSAQPWLSFESIGLLILGLAWAYYLFSIEWSERQREQAAVAYSSGILLLAAALTVAFATGMHIPFWPSEFGFGFFPNRNQTSNVLGLGGIIIYAIGLHRLRQGRRTWWIWLASLSLICWALILSQSRAGIILFFFGALAWNIWWLATGQDRGQRAIALGVLVFLFAVLLVNGGRTLSRFTDNSAEVFSATSNGRVPIYKDTLSLLKETPIVGNGLGNFPALFGLHRQYSAAANEAIHPESDWLWLAADLGWPAVLILIALFVWWIKQCLPFDAGTSRWLRMAAMICGCGFAIHGIVDVSGHRIGALWPALLLASIALHPKTDCRSSRVTARIFKGVGLILICFGAFWFASIADGIRFPTSESVRRLRQGVSNAIEAKQYESAVKLATRGLEIAPLDWKLYYNRATAEAVSSVSHSDAHRDFSVVRYLMPYWPELSLQEGQVWAAVGEDDFAVEAWTETLQHAGQSAARLYDEMFALAENDPVLIARLRELAYHNNDCLLVYLRKADPFAFQIELEQLLAKDRQSESAPNSSAAAVLSSFSSGDLKKLFQLWYQKGDKLALAETLKQNPDWEKIGWRELARVYTDYQDYRQAYDTLLRFTAPPEMPKPRESDSVAALATLFRVTPNPIRDGTLLALAQERDGQPDDALRTLAQLYKQPNTPQELHFIEARIWAEKDDWKNAAEALTVYLDKTE